MLYQPMDISSRIHQVRRLLLLLLFRRRFAAQAGDKNFPFSFFCVG